MRKSIAHSLGEAVIAAEQAWRAADHVLHVTFPAVQDPKLLLRALEHLNRAARITLSTSLKCAHIYQRVPLRRLGAENLETFFSSCAKQYELSTADCARLRTLLELGRRHRASGMEFSQKGKMILLDDEQGSIEIRALQLEELSDAVRRVQLRLRQDMRALAKRRAEGKE